MLGKQTELMDRIIASTFFERCDGAYILSQVMDSGIAKSILSLFMKEDT